MPSPGEVPRIFVEAWNKRDFTTFRKLLADDYTYVGADGTRQTGPDAGVQAAAGFTKIFRDAEAKIVSIHDDGETSVAEFIITGTQGGAFMGMPVTNKVVTVQRCNIIAVSDGLVHSKREYMNRLSVLLPLGAIVQPPAPPAPPAPQP